MTIEGSASSSNTVNTAGRLDPEITEAPPSPRQAAPRLDSVAPPAAPQPAKVATPRDGLQPPAGAAYTVRRYHEPKSDQVVMGEPFAVYYIKYHGVTVCTRTPLSASELQAHHEKEEAAAQVRKAEREAAEHAARIRQEETQAQLDAARAREAEASPAAARPAPAPPRPGYSYASSVGEQPSCWRALFPRRAR